MFFTTFALQFENFWYGVSSAFRKGLLTPLQRAMDLLGFNDPARWAGFLDKMEHFGVVIGDWIGSVLSPENLNRLADGLGHAVTWLESFFDPKEMDVWKKRWDDFSSDASTIWTTVLKPMFTDLMAGLKWVVDSIKEHPDIGKHLLELGVGTMILNTITGGLAGILVAGAVAAVLRLGLGALLLPILPYALPIAIAAAALALMPQNKEFEDQHQQALKDMGVKEDDPLSTKLSAWARHLTVKQFLPWSSSDDTPSGVTPGTPYATAPVAPATPTAPESASPRAPDITPGSSVVVGPPDDPKRRQSDQMDELLSHTSSMSDSLKKLNEKTETPH
jgi:hypothetical protein